MAAQLGDFAPFMQPFLEVGPRDVFASVPSREHHSVMLALNAPVRGDPVALTARHRGDDTTPWLVDLLHGIPPQTPAHAEAMARWAVARTSHLALVSPPRFLDRLFHIFWRPAYTRRLERWVQKRYLLSRAWLLEPMPCDTWMTGCYGGEYGTWLFVDGVLYWGGGAPPCASVGRACASGDGSHSRHN